MLNIYYGDESLNREKFIFDNIDPKKKTIIIVPDQFSLQMEQDALAYFSEKKRRESGNPDATAALLELMVADFSSLGHKVVMEAEGREPELIDRYGRHMLLTMIIDRLAENDLSIYGKMAGRNSFVEMTNQLISEMKRFGVGAKQLADIQEDSLPQESFLKFKLQDIEKIFESYEEAIKGKYLDSEDYIKFYGDLMASSPVTLGADIWVYGFDTFTPLNMQVMGNLLTASDRMNIVMTWGVDKHPGEPENTSDPRVLTTAGGEGLFDLTKHVIDELKNMAEDYSEGDVSVIPVPNEYIRQSASIEDAVLVEASNVYAEAERAAAYVLELVRDNDYRYGDIRIICNDMNLRGPILRRTLERWGIPVFADYKRGVLHQPVVGFVLSLMKIVAKGYDPDAIVGLTKTGLMDWSRQDEELLQNYTHQFRVRGTGWKKEFTRGLDEGKDSWRDFALYSPEEMARLNEMRTEVVNIIEGARDSIGRRNTACEKARGLYEFLEHDFGIRERIEKFINKQQELELHEGAAETAQSWSMTCRILEQIIRILGDSGISNDVFRNLVEAGLESMEIGLVPVTGDCVVMGTLQRTRISSTKALIVVGANEGVLPLEPGDTGLLTRKELDVLEEMKLNISKREAVVRQEEQLAVYRVFSVPEERIYVSCSLADANGGKTAPSGVFSALRGISSGVLGDLGSGSAGEMISSRKGTLVYMAEAMREYMETGRITDRWLDTMKWYREKDPEDFGRVLAGMTFDNRIEALGQDVAEALYMKDTDALKVSASRLETYSKCPFAHFIQYGLGAQEQRIFEVDARGIGNVYHNCLMEFSQKLSQDEWESISEEECRSLVREILEAGSGNADEGVFAEDAEGKYRMRRITDICGDVAWALVSQVRKGNIGEMHFEMPFGLPGRPGEVLPPVEVELENGKRAVLRGKIDRLDIINVPEGDDTEQAIRIIDYKTGNNEIDVNHFKIGYKLQLMVYMNAALNGENSRSGGDRMVPAGVFYFKIRERDMGEKEKEVEDAYGLEGIMVDKDSILEAMDENLKDGSSSVIPVKYVKTNNGYKATGKGTLLSGDDFEELCRETENQVERICREIQAGQIAVEPKREKTGSGYKDVNSCTYCGYRSICMFDTSFDGCSFKTV